jgi:hypothetical protein
MKSEEFAYALNIDNEGLTAPTSAVGLFLCQVNILETKGLYFGSDINVAIKFHLVIW